MSLKKTKLAIISVNYNGLSDTIDFLESLKKAKIPKTLAIQTYIVDNASRDDSVDVLDKKYPEIRLIASPENLGFAGGNNLGIRQALREKSDWIMLINNDTVIDKNLFNNLLKSPLEQKSTGVLGGLVYFVPGFEFKKRYTKSQIGKVIWSAGGNLDWDNVYGSNYLVDQVDTGQLEKPFPTDFVTGAFLLTRADVLKQVGLFDEKFFMYLEDVDLCMRIRQAGYKVLTDPRLKISHKVSQSSGIGSSFNDYFITRNRLLFGLRYAKLRTKIALLREAIRFLISGRQAQKIAVQDFFSGRFGKGSWVK